MALPEPKSPKTYSRTHGTPRALDTMADGDGSAQIQIGASVKALATRSPQTGDDSTQR